MTTRPGKSDDDTGCATLIVAVIVLGILYGWWTVQPSPPPPLPAWPLVPWMPHASDAPEARP